MTRGRAIEILEEHPWSTGEVDGDSCIVAFDAGLDDFEDALDMAIAALREQETVTKCNDLYDEDGGEILNRTESDTVKPVEIDQFKTNSDHIRSMTDEELADYMSEHSIEDICYIVCGGNCKAMATFNKTSHQVCREIVADWLKQPYKEEP